MPGAGQPQFVWFAKACAIAFWAWSLAGWRCRTIWKRVKPSGISLKNMSGVKKTPKKQNARRASFGVIPQPPPSRPLGGQRRTLTQHRLCKIAMYNFTIAIGALYPSGFFWYLQPNTRMAKRPSTAITGDAKLIYHSGFWCVCCHFPFPFFRA